MEIVVVKRNIFLEISKVLLNDIFAELDRRSWIMDILTNILNLDELQVDHMLAKIRQKVRRNIYQSGKSSFKYFFFSLFSDNWDMGEISTISLLSIMHVFLLLAGFYEFHFKFKEENS